MSDSPSEEPIADGARMELEPDAIHETDSGVFLDCPQCGSNISIVQVVTDGRCSGQLDNEAAETEDDTKLQQGCNAELSLELIWET